MHSDAVDNSDDAACFGVLWHADAMRSFNFTTS
jgi:hypothetical protein